MPVSRLVKEGDDDGPKKKNRDEYRKAKELEELRKLGSEPAAVDEDGKGCQAEDGDEGAAAVG